MTAINNAFATSPLGTIRAGYARWDARRRTARDLRRLSDESLWDIGMNRADVETLLARM